MLHPIYIIASRLFLLAWILIGSFGATGFGGNEFYIPNIDNKKVTTFLDEGVILVASMLNPYII